MTENKNALAELAAELKRSLDLQMPGTSYYRDRTVFCTPEVVDKSMRIIAELAKINWITLFGVNQRAFPNSAEARAAVENCRAIAEEGGDEVKVTIRIEQDKYHFVKRSFKSLEEAERYIFMAKVAKTKNDLKNLLR